MTPKLTQNQLHELLESESARSLVENAEERGFVEPAELEDGPRFGETNPVPHLFHAEAVAVHPL